MQNDLEVRQAVRIEVLSNDHLSETQKMLKEFDSATHFFKKQVFQLERKIADAEVKYQNREPREQDLQKIHDLEHGVEQTKKKMHSLEGELEYVKLELLNREINYNKVFGSRTVIVDKELNGGAKPTGLNSKVCDRDAFTLLAVFMD